MSIKVRSYFVWVQTNVWSQFRQNQTRAADSEVSVLGAITLKYIAEVM